MRRGDRGDRDGERGVDWPEARMLAWIVASRTAPSARSAGEGEDDGPKPLPTGPRRRSNGPPRMGGCTMEKTG